MDGLRAGGPGGGARGSGGGTDPGDAEGPGWRPLSPMERYLDDQHDIHGDDPGGPLGPGRELGDDHGLGDDGGGHEIDEGAFHDVLEHHGDEHGGGQKHLDHQADQQQPWQRDPGLQHLCSD